MKPLLLAALILCSAAAGEPGKRYTLPHMVTTYREAGNQITIEMSYAVPRAGIAAAGGNRDAVRIEQTLSVVDSLGVTCHKSWARPTSLPQAGFFGIRKNYVLAHEQIRLPANEYDLYLGVRDLKVKSTGSFHSVCRTPGENGRFDLSDLLLATDIQTHEGQPISRKNLTIHPNPLRLYQTGERVFVYLELYNLTRDDFGQTNFEIAFRMERPAEEELDAELFEALDRSSVSAASSAGQTYLVPSNHRKGIQVRKTWEGQEGQTTVASRYVGDSSTDLTFLEFDVSQLSDGIHKLTISATDLHRSITVEKSTLFRVLSE